MAADKGQKQTDQINSNKGLMGGGAGSLKGSASGGAKVGIKNQIDTSNAGIDGGMPWGAAKAGMAIEPKIAGTAMDDENTDSGWGNSSTKPTDMGKDHPLPAVARSVDAQVKGSGGCTSLGESKAVVGGWKK